MSVVKLKECPWCGKRNLRVFAWDKKTHYVECLTDTCRSSGPLGEKPEEAVIKWNGGVGRVLP